MVTETLLSDDLKLPNVSATSSHPMDSSRLLLGLMTFARKAIVRDDDASSHETLEGAISTEALRSLISALHFRDVATVLHSRRTAMLAVGMAQHLGWEPRQQKYLEIAALLHDIGKIGVPDSILYKPGQLNPDEAELMALHQNIGIDVMQACRVHNEVIDIVSHSNRYDDPKSDAVRNVSSTVHLGARILAVADAYDSLSTTKTYRTGKPHEDIIQILMEAAGTQFDGNVVCALARWIENDGLPFKHAASEAKDNGHRPEAARPEETLEASSLGHIFSYLYVLESLYDGFYLVDSTLQFVVWNRGIEALLGIPASEIIGQKCSTKSLAFTNESNEPLREDEFPINRVIAAGQPSTSTVQVTRFDGREIKIELQTVPLFDSQGNFYGAAEIFRDLSRSSRRPREFRELKLAASRDALTSVANRGELETQLAVMIAEFDKAENAEPFSLIFLDVDFFKNVNDTFGHTVGDHVLVDVARLLQNETYSGELVARYGGEEFVILCPGTTIDQALRRAERLRLALPRTDIGGLEDYKITASFGVTEIESGDSVESLLCRADKALYKAKDSGRNKSCALSCSDAEEANDQADSDETVDTNPDPFIYAGTMSACIAADMIVYKLGGFVTDNHAKLIDVTQKRAVFQLGRTGLFGYWGSSEKKQSVEIKIEFGEKEAATRGNAASHQVNINVEIRPLGIIRDADIFQNRAHRLMRSLRAYFVSD